MAKNKPVVLLVEDDHDLRKQLVGYMNDEETYEFVGLADANAAYSWLTSNPRPDAIVTDYIMDTIKGDALVETALRTQIPCIMISGSEDLAQEELKKKGLIVVLMPKPVDPGVLAHRLDQILGTQHKKQSSPKIKASA